MVTAAQVPAKSKINGNAIADLIPDLIASNKINVEMEYSIKLKSVTMGTTLEGMDAVLPVALKKDGAVMPLDA